MTWFYFFARLLRIKTKEPLCLPRHKLFKYEVALCRMDGDFFLVYIIPKYFLCNVSLNLSMQFNIYVPTGTGTKIRRIKKYTECYCPTPTSGCRKSQLWTDKAYHIATKRSKTRK